MTIQQKVDAAVKAVCPIHGISFGRPADKATWRIDFDDAATPEQQQAALDVVAAFDVQNAREQARVDAEIAARERAEMAPRFSREATLIGIVKDYMRDHGADFATAVANLTNPQHQHYSAGFVKLKALDDAIKVLRAQRP